MLLLRVVLNILVRNASPRGPMCFRCLMFSLSGLNDSQMYYYTKPKKRNKYRYSIDMILGLIIKPLIYIYYKIIMYSNYKYILG